MFLQTSTHHIVWVLFVQIRKYRWRKENIDYIKCGQHFCLGKTLIGVRKRSPGDRQVGGLKSVMFTPWLSQSNNLNLDTCIIEAERESVHVVQYYQARARISGVSMSDCWRLISFPAYSIHALRQNRLSLTISVKESY